jgi:hypothetical protein
MFLTYLKGGVDIKKVTKKMPKLGVVWANFHYTLTVTIERWSESLKGYFLLNESSFFAHIG